MSYTTLWEVPDGLWERIERVLPREKKKGSVGRPALLITSLWPVIMYGWTASSTTWQRSIRRRT